MRQLTEIEMLKNYVDDLEKDKANLKSKIDLKEFKLSTCYQTIREQHNEIKDLKEDLEIEKSKRKRAENKQEELEVIITSLDCKIFELKNALCKGCGKDET